VLRRGNGAAQERIVGLDHVLVQAASQFSADGCVLRLVDKIDLFPRILHQIVKLNVAKILASGEA
jgi:hypothetical protein